MPQSKLRFHLLLGLLWSFLGLKVMGLVTYVFQYALIESAPYTMAAALANDRQVKLVAYLTLLVHLVSAIVFCRWIYSANRAVRLMGASDLPHSPAMAVGSFFIPFVNLVVPYEAMRDLWKASIDARTWRAQARSNALPLWWTFWLGNGVLGYAVFFMSRNARTVDSLKVLTISLMVEAIAGIIVGSLALQITSSISKRINNQIMANQSPEPTPVSVTPAADARVAPDTGAAQL